MADRNFTDDYLTGIKRLIHGEQHGRAFSESFNSRFAASGIDLGDLSFAQPAAFYGQTNMQNSDGNGLWRTFNMPTGGIVYYESVHGGSLRYFDGGPFEESAVWPDRQFDSFYGQRMAARGQTVAIGEFFWTGDGAAFAVKVSTDGGINWIETTLDSVTYTGSGIYPMNLDVAVTESGVIWAVSGFEGGNWLLQKSEDGGETFTVALTLPVTENHNSYSVSLDATDERVLFAYDDSHNVVLQSPTESFAYSGYYYFPSFAISGETLCMMCVSDHGVDTPTVILRNGGEVWSGPYLGSASGARQWDLRGDSGYWIAAPANMSGSGGRVGAGESAGVLFSLDDGLTWNLSALPSAVETGADMSAVMVDVYNGRFVAAHHQYDLNGGIMPLRVFTGGLNENDEIEWTLIFEESRAYGYGYGYPTACRFTKE